MRGPRLIHLWGPLSHCYEDKRKSAKLAENDDVDTLKAAYGQ